MCCGRKTGVSRQDSPDRAGFIPGYKSWRRAAAGSFGIRFQYVGATGLTVLGPISGVRYRFDGRGAIVPVDPRDAPSLGAVPNLRRLAQPVG